MLQVYLDRNKNFYAELLYITKVFFFNKGIPFITADEIHDNVLVIDDDPNAHIRISFNFYKVYLAQPCLQTPDENELRKLVGENDLLLCFYLLNSIQEFNSSNVDNLGRFKFENSLQQKNKWNHQNIVQQIFDRIYSSQSLFKGFKEKKIRTKAFLSHDIDNIYGAWKEDGFATFKQLKPVTGFKLFLDTILNKPSWFNMDKIMKIHNEYDMKSTFFWIVNKGKTGEKLVNADYSIDNSKIRNEIKQIEENKFENGLHKSISAMSFEKEISKLGFTPLANRNHYLKFNLPEHYKTIEQSGIKIDCSLGFAENYGFRNNYGQPFQPYNFQKKQAFNFMEVPLHIMDRTFYSYLKVPAAKVPELVIDFFEKNKENCVLSVLWHNNFFGSIKYEGYFEAYKKILEYFYESGIKSISLNEINTEFRIS